MSRAGGGPAGIDAFVRASSPSIRSRRHAAARSSSITGSRSARAFARSIPASRPRAIAAWIAHARSHGLRHAASRSSTRSLSVASQIRRRPVAAGEPTQPVCVRDVGREDRERCGDARRGAAARRAPRLPRPLPCRPRAAPPARARWRSTRGAPAGSPRRALGRDRARRVAPARAGRLARRRMARMASRRRRSGRRARHRLRTPGRGPRPSPRPRAPAPTSRSTMSEPEVAVRVSHVRAQHGIARRRAPVQRPHEAADPELGGHPGAVEAARRAPGRWHPRAGRARRRPPPRSAGRRGRRAPDRARTCRRPRWPRTPRSGPVRPRP